MHPISGSPLLRALAIVVPGLLVALYLATQLGQGLWTVPTAVAASLILFATYMLFFRNVTVGAIVLGLLLFGYIVGNRGFAQLHIGGHTPIYVGELGLGIGAALLLVRFALRRQKIIPKTALTTAIVAFLIIGAIRLAFDTTLEPMSINRIAAVRDAATVYYALFFFIAFQLGQNQAARRVVESFLLAGCIVLLPIAIIYICDYQDIFNGLTVGGYPLIAQKGDLMTTYLALASFYFFLRPAEGGLRVCLKALSLMFLACMLACTARAALFGFACAMPLVLIARRPQFLFYQAIAVVLLLLLVALLQVARLSHDSGFVGRVLDRIESTTDLSGRHTYRGEYGESSAQNNQFRIVWWQSVINETMDKDPWFGLGFGYDLAKKFLTAYEAPLNVFEFDTRSPHNIWITILGRMGLIGVTCFAFITFFIFRTSIRLARSVARGEVPAAALAPWCAAIVILGSASFGVVLEGPMGAIPFWSFLGIAAGEEMSFRSARKQEAMALPSKESTRNALVGAESILRRSIK